MNFEFTSSKALSKLESTHGRVLSTKFSLPTARRKQGVIIFSENEFAALH